MTSRTTTLLEYVDVRAESLGGLYHALGQSCATNRPSAPCMQECRRVWLARVSEGSEGARGLSH